MYYHPLQPPIFRLPFLGSGWWQTTTGATPFFIACKSGHVAGLVLFPQKGLALGNHSVITGN
jgi:hypothetical protein